MAVFSGLAMLGMAVSIGGMAMQYSAQRSAAKAANNAAMAGMMQAQEMRRQGELEQKRADINNARSLRAAIRNSRIARATVVNAGANAGTLTSSGVMGGTASIASQDAANRGYFGQMTDINEDVYASQGEQYKWQMYEGQARMAAGSAQGRASMGGAIAGVGQSIFSAGGGFHSMFGGKA